MFKNSLTYLFLNLVSIFFICLPRLISIRLGSTLGLLMYYIYPKRKSVVIKNLNIAFPNKNSTQLEKLIINLYKHYAIIITDFLRQKKINLDKIKLNIDDQTKEILSLKTGFILMTAHIGNWEIILPILNSYKKTAIVVKIQNNSGGDRFIQENRKFKNIELISMRGSKKQMIRALNENKILGLASDQNAGEKGVQVPFFNKDTSVPKGAAFFHYKTKKPIVVGFCILNKDYSYTFKLKKLDIDYEEKDFDKFAFSINTKYSFLLQEEIKKNPEQYFWFHKKWGREFYL